MHWLTRPIALMEVIRVSHCDPYGIDKAVFSKFHINDEEFHLCEAKLKYNLAFKHHRKFNTAKCNLIRFFYYAIDKLLELDDHRDILRKKIIAGFYVTQPSILQTVQNLKGKKLQRIHIDREGVIINIIHDMLYQIELNYNVIPHTLSEDAFLMNHFRGLTVDFYMCYGMKNSLTIRKFLDEMGSDMPITGSINQYLRCVDEIELSDNSDFQLISSRPIEVREKNERPVRTTCKCNIL